MIWYRIYHAILDLLLNVIDNGVRSKYSPDIVIKIKKKATATKNKNKTYKKKAKQNIQKTKQDKTKQKQSKRMWKALAWPHPFTYKGGLKHKANFTPPLFYWSACTQPGEVNGNLFVC